jgi:hypothetical protein
MKLIDARKAITSRYLTEFALLYPAIPIFIDNKGDSSKGTADKGDSWVRITVISTSPNGQTLGKPGNRKYNKLGFINCQIFTSINQGTNANDEMADASKELFEGVSFASKLWCYDGRVETIGSDGEFWQQNAINVFEYEYTR